MWKCGVSVTDRMSIAVQFHVSYVSMTSDVNISLQRLSGAAEEVTGHSSYSSDFTIVVLHCSLLLLLWSISLNREEYNLTVWTVQNH